MSDTILCHVEEEPQGFHPAGFRGFSVRLGHAAPRDAETLTTDVAETQAEEAHFAFIDALPTARFAFYQLQDRSLNKLGVAVEAITEAHDAGAIALRAAFKTWLAAPVPGRPKVFYATKLPDPQQQIEFGEVAEHGEMALNATALISATASQPAPIPQQLGLAWVLRVNADALAKQMVGNGPLVVAIDGLLGFEAQEKVALPTEPLAGGEVELGSAVGYLRCRASVIKTLTDDATSLVNAESGFLTENHAGPEVHRFLERLEQRAGTQFSAYLAATAIRWPVEELDATQRLRALAWQVLHGVSSALDTMLLALQMPGRKTRDGALLTPLLDELDAVLRDSPVQLTRQQLRDSVRAGLRAHPVFDRSSGNFLAGLLDLAGMGATPLNADAATLAKLDWLKLLLLAALSDNNTLPWNEAERRFDELEKEPDGAVRELDRLLGGLQDKLIGEVGLETCVMRLLRNSQVKQSVNTHLSASATSPATDHLSSAFASAADQFERRLQSKDVDGAHLSRLAVGSLLVDLVTRTEAGSVVVQTVDLLSNRLKSWNFFARRLGLLVDTPGAVGTIEALLEAACARPPSGTQWLIREKAAEKVDKAAAAQMQAFLHELLPPPGARFQPDTAPRPLAVQATVDAAVDDSPLGGDDFSAMYAGLGLLLRREDTPAADSVWAHANLATIWCIWTKPVQQALTVQPLPPTVIDGRRQLFVEYYGVPFASQAYAGTLPGAQTPPARQPFTFSDYPEDTKSFAPVPELAYGLAYRHALFACGRSGALPLALQGERPWRSIGREQIAGRVPEPAMLQVYRRRTPIGATALRDPPGDPRIGAAVDGVRPLAADDPRLGLAADSGSSSSFLDLLRNADGSGAIAMPSPGKSTTVTLRKLQFWSASGGASLSIEILGRADIENTTDDDSKVTLELDAGPRKDDIELRFDRDDDGKLGLHLDGSKHSLNTSAWGPAIWLRLRLHAQTTGAAVSLSLADPRGDQDGAAAASQPTPPRLLLCAPPGPIWRDRFKSIKARQLELPRAPFADVQRWLANPRLAADWLAPLTKEQQNELRVLLLSADLMRTSLPELAKLLDRLPDPAVRAIELQVRALDGLRAAPGELSELPQLQCQTLHRAVPTLGEVVAEWIGARNSRDLRGADPLVLLRAVDQAFTTEVRITCTRELPQSWLTSSKTAINFRTAEGVLAELAVRPLVPRSCFSDTAVVFAPIDEGLLQWTTGSATVNSVDHLAFAPVVLQVEAMTGPMASSDRPAWLRSQDEWCQAASAAISLKPALHARAYSMQLKTTADKECWRWRQLGWMDIDTQRWRFTGRPIQNGYQPPRPSVGIPTVEIRESEFFNASSFLKEAFDERPDADSQRRSVAVHDETTLIEMPWEKASATIFRHRFILRSRYEGALAQAPHARCATWSGQEPNSWRTIVVLAERGRIELDRPQLRALIPLTHSSLGAVAQGKGTPPIMAVLQDRPFDRGGLAERVSAEVRLGIGYELSTQLRPLDARKEAGPDPRLAYRALPEAVAQALLFSVQGPMGLTFDNPRGGGQAFPNSALLLHPRRFVSGGPGAGLTLEPVRMEESFFSVRLRRYLDPGWLVPESAMDVGGLPLDAGAWWLHGKLNFADGTHELLSITGQVPPPPPLLRARREGTAPLKLQVHKSFVDDTVDADAKDGNWLTVATLPVTDAEVELALMHVPGVPGSAELALFVLPGKGHVEDEDFGHRWELVTSLEWQISKGTKTMRLQATGFDASGAINASIGTPLRWARTGRDFDTVCASAFNGVAAADTQDLLVRDLNMVLDGQELMWTNSDEAMPLWIRSRQGTQRFPTTTQRHMAVLLSEAVSALGNASERVLGAYLLRGKTLTLPNEVCAATHARLFEFELPSRPLVWRADGNSLVPDEYRSAYHDLVAIGFDTERRKGLDHELRLSFHIRLVASSADARNLQTLTVELLRSDGNGKVTWNRPASALAAVHAVEFELALAFDADSVRVLARRWIGADGQVLPVTDPELGNFPWPLAGDGTGLGLQGLWLKLAAVAGNPGAIAELWGESSLLASPILYDTYSNDSIDFDWFFGKEDTPPADAVSVAALRTLPEAQARQIAMSPRINLGPRTG